MRTIKIRGMSCNHCVKVVTEALEEIRAIKHVTVNLEKGEASFDEAEPVNMDTIREKIKKAGYEVDS